MILVFTDSSRPEMTKISFWPWITPDHISAPVLGDCWLQQFKEGKILRGLGLGETVATAWRRRRVITARRNMGHDVGVELMHSTDKGIENEKAKCQNSGTDLDMR